MKEKKYFDKTILKSLVGLYSTTPTKRKYFENMFEFEKRFFQKFVVNLHKNKTTL